MGENICKWWDQQGINFQNIQTAHTAQKISNIKKTNNPVKKNGQIFKMDNQEGPTV